MAENQETKTCKYCQSEIPKKAKICPNCRKKQKHTALGVTLLVIGILIALLGFCSSMGDSTTSNNSSVVASKVGEIEKVSQEEQTVSNIFHSGDVLETKDWKITFVDVGTYVPENEFLRAKDGYEYIKFDFIFENISQSDKTVSSLINWVGYADNVKVDQSYTGEGSLDGTVSAGRQLQGSIVLEVPKNAEKIELEYDIEFWTNDKIIFIGR